MLRSYVQIWLIVFLFLSNAIAAPLYLEPMEGVEEPDINSKHDNALKVALESANRQIAKMKVTVDKANKAVRENRLNDPYLAKIVAVFTKHYNLPEITRIVKALHTQTVVVLSYATDLPENTLADLNPKTKLLQISHAFYEPPFLDIHRAGMLIHEASHAFGPTYDYWNRENGKLTPVTIGKAKAGAVLGYWMMQYDEVVKEVPELLHLNADTWAVFGFYLEYGTFPPKRMAPSVRRRSLEAATHCSNSNTQVASTCYADSSLHARAPGAQTKLTNPPHREQNTSKNKQTGSLSSPSDGSFIEYTKYFMPPVSGHPMQSTTLTKKTPVAAGK